MEETLIIEVWDTFRDYIPEKSRETAANQYVDYLLGKDVETSELEGVLGYDPHLDAAIQLVLSEASEDEDDEEDYDYQEDED
jgi:hypothetical protein